MSQVVRKNSTLRSLLGATGVSVLEQGAGAIQRILPHVELSAWTQNSWRRSASVWTNQSRTEIRLTFGVGEGVAGGGSLTTTISRRYAQNFEGAAGRVLDVREHSLCKLIADETTRLSQLSIALRTHQIDGVSNADHQSNHHPLSLVVGFDEAIVARHIEDHHSLDLDVSKVLSALHTLSEQSYENKALTFGCLLDPRKTDDAADSTFPGSFLTAKKFKALSDGYRTAYRVSRYGRVVDFIDLKQLKPLPQGHHYFPEWAESLALASRRGICGIALSRQGDILIFDEGTLRFTYRYGRWQYWNHSHLVNLLSDTCRAQHVLPKIRGRVVGAVYRAALDVSFRRSGGLFVILRNRASLRELVKAGDAIDDVARTDVDRDFDEVVKNRKVQNLPRSVLVELASLDGAVVLANSGDILAYGSVLAPRRVGRLKGTEGSRTKAAIGASNYGLAVKISSDGDIAIYHQGEEFIRI